MRVWDYGLMPLGSVDFANALSQHMSISSNRAPLDCGQVPKGTHDMNCPNLGMIRSCRLAGSWVRWLPSASSTIAWWTCSLRLCKEHLYREIPSIVLLVLPLCSFRDVKVDHTGA